MSDTVTCVDSEFSIQIDSLCYQISPDVELNFFWDFGDGTTSTEQSPSHKYKNEGTYQIKGLVINGLDTVRIAFDSLYINPKPKSGFELSANPICAPDSVQIKHLGSQDYDSIKYELSDGSVFFKPNLDTYHQDAKTIEFIQKVWASTGCASFFTDTLDVLPGLQPKDTLSALTVNVLDQQSTELFWLPVNGATGYSIFFENEKIDELTNGQTATWQHSNVATSTASYTYQIQAQDFCKRQGYISNPLNTIYLQYSHIQNRWIELQWNAFEKWPNGVKHYSLEASADGNNWQEVWTTESTNTKDDRTDLQLLDKIFYRIKAHEQKGFQQSSVSNVVEANLLPTLFIPNAFSPNGDGVNEVFKVGHFGLQSFECRIFSQTGQIVAYYNNPDEIWDGKMLNLTAPIGTYMYLINAITHQGEAIKKSGNLVLIR